MPSDFVNSQLMPSPRQWCLPAAVIVLLTVVATPARSTGDESPQPAAGASTASVRTPWTTSRVVGSPEPPPPFKVVRAFPNLKFEHPLLMARCPGSNRLFVGEQAGKLYSFADEPDARADLFFDLPRELRTIEQLPGAQTVEAVYGLAFHPDFETNRHCFICYTLKGPDTQQPNLADGTRVSRFVVTDAEPPRIDPSSEQVVLSFLQGGHNGGDLQFGPDGMLYISTGDAASPNPPDPFNTGQDISDLLSSILRIDVNRKDEGRNYAVPADNPFVGREGARPEVWAYGFRNPWRMSFDRQTGELFVGDVGWELWEMVHRIEKGGNYGWSAMEGPQPINTDQISPTPIHPALIELPHTIASSVTGGLVYRGRKFPELRGAYVFGDWETRRLWAARFDGDRTREMPEIAHPSVRIVAFADNHDGELYFLDYDAGTIHTIERNDAATGQSEFPTRLSQTGLFAKVTDQTPMAGVVPFSINCRQWQDGATAEHWAAFPGESPATLHAEAKPIPGMVDWRKFRLHFPAGAVLVRTIAHSGRRIETQLLHFDGVDWHAYTYAWRDDQTDADLVPADGAEREIGEGSQRRMWQFHSRTQCLSCHNIQSEFALAFQPEQLNRPGADGRNQLMAFTGMGLIRRVNRDEAPLPAFDVSSVAREHRLVDPADESQPLEDRARAYLHANCGHCHCTGGGGTVSLRLQYPVKVQEMMAVGVRPARGDFALPDAAIIRPGDPCASTLYFRMAKFGRDRMPHLGSEQPDEAGLQLISRWISGMEGREDEADSTVAIRSSDELLSQPPTALRLARLLAQDKLSGSDRDELMSAAGKLPAGPIRDLFEGYLPQGERGERKLGSNPRPGTILALSGDAGRGETLFWSEAVRCGSCHRVGARGTPVGPDLSNIGTLRSRADLLESLLEPSRRIEPKYAAYTALTSSGLLATGLLVARDEKSVVLRDAQNKERVIPAGEVEQLQPSRTSLMPDGQMAGLTAREAADLLEYLATRKSPVSARTGD